MWEANFARYLNWLLSKKLIRSWEYESDEFEFVGIKRGTRFYKSDFKVIEISGAIVYFELKGFMDAKSKTALNRMAKYYPGIKIVVIDKKGYASIARICKGLIPHWETAGASKNEITHVTSPFQIAGNRHSFRSSRNSRRSSVRAE